MDCVCTNEESRCNVRLRITMWKLQTQQSHAKSVLLATQKNARQPVQPTTDLNLYKHIYVGIAGDLFEMDSTPQRCTSSRVLTFFGFHKKTSTMMAETASRCC